MDVAPADMIMQPPGLGFQANAGRPRMSAAYIVSRRASDLIRPERHVAIPGYWWNILPIVRIAPHGSATPEGMGSY